MKIAKLLRAKEVLQDTLKLFRKSGRWITGEMAKDVNGWACNPRSKKACTFCVVGGFMRIGGKSGSKLAAQAISEFGTSTAVPYFEFRGVSFPVNNLITFNDSYAKSWEAVREVIRNTIKGINKALKAA